MQTDSRDIIQLVNIFSAGNGNVNSARPTEPKWWIHFLPVSHSHHCLFLQQTAPCPLILVSRHRTTFISTFHSVFLRDSPLPYQVNTACFRTCFLPIFSHSCLCPWSPISDRWPSWSLNCNLKSYSSSSSTNFNHLLTIWSKVHWSARAINFNGLWIRTRLLPGALDWNLAEEK